MNKYIFLTSGISNIGGAELYLRQKMLYVKSIGYDTIIISQSLNGPIYINEFKKDCYIVPEIGYPIKYFINKDCEKILEKLYNIVGEIDENSIIESHLPNFALWGEKLAHKYKCKNFIYLLSENYPNYSSTMYSFLKFKYQRKELVGINKNTLNLLFKNKVEISPSNSYYLDAYMGDSIEDIDSPLVDLVDESAAMRIACYGRLEKRYVKEAVRCISNICINNKSEIVQLFLVGGTRDQQIISAYKNKTSIPNLFIYITDYIYPVPFAFLNKMDFIIAGSGAAYSSVKNGLLTVSMDIYGKPIGVMGITTNNSQHRDSSDQDSDSLEHYYFAIKNHQYDNKKLKRIKTTSDRSIEFDKHMNFILNSSEEKKYYIVEMVGGRFKTFTFRLLGISLFSKIKALIKKH